MPLGLAREHRPQRLDVRRDRLPLHRFIVAGTGLQNLEVAVDEVGQVETGLASLGPIGGQDGARCDARRAVDEDLAVVENRGALHRGKKLLVTVGRRQRVRGRRLGRFDGALDLVDVRVRWSRCAHCSE